MSPEQSVQLDFSNLGDETARVFSDGVPERDYPEGCQLVVPNGRKDNYKGEEILDAKMPSLTTARRLGV
jgi:hypothetical protein